MKVSTADNSLTISPDCADPKAMQTARPDSGPLPGWLKWILISLLVAAPFIYEMRTSAVQSWILSKYARKMSYKVEPGPSPSVVFPKHGPFDIRAGYGLIPDFVRRLNASGYEIAEQARFSPELERAAKWGILPPYSELTSTKLTISGMDGGPLFQAPVVGHGCAGAAAAGGGCARPRHPLGGGDSEHR